MTNLITLTIPNDDHVALRAFGKALEEIALAHGAPSTQLQVVNEITMTGEQTEALRERLNKALGEPEVDTTAQQVESLAGTYPGTPTPDATYETIAEKMFFDVVRTDNSGTPWDERIHSASKALNADGTWRLRRKPKDMDEAEWLQLVADVKLELSGEEQYDQEELARQEQELSQRYDIPEPPVTPPGDDFHTDAGVVTEQTVAGIPPIPVPPPVTEWQNEVTHPESGDLCSVCMKPQFSSPSGVTCENGHGGAPAYEKPVPPPVVVPPVPRELSTEALSKAVAVPYGESEWVSDFPKLMKFLTERHGKIDVPTVNQLLAVDGLAALTDLNAHPDKIGPFVARVKAHLGE